MRRKLLYMAFSCTTCEVLNTRDFRKDDMIRKLSWFEKDLWPEPSKAGTDSVSFSQISKHHRNQRWKLKAWNTMNCSAHRFCCLFYSFSNGSKSVRIAKTDIIYAFLLALSCLLTATCSFEQFKKSKYSEHAQSCFVCSFCCLFLVQLWQNILFF